MADMEVGPASWRNEAFGEGGAGKTHVFFYEVQVKNQAKSLAAGRPIFESRVKIKKLVPGDSRLIIDTYARPEQFEEFPEAYARFTNKKENRPVGTPLDMWPVLSDQQKAEFRALNIFTIEQFANLPDGAAERIMGLHEFRKKARAFILAQEAGEKLVKMEEDAKVAAEKEAAQAQVIADLNARLAALEGTRPPPVAKRSQAA